MVSINTPRGTYRHKATNAGNQLILNLYVENVQAGGQTEVFLSTPGLRFTGRELLLGAEPRVPYLGPGVVSTINSLSDRALVPGAQTFPGSFVNQALFSFTFLNGRTCAGLSSIPSVLFEDRASIVSGGTLPEPWVDNYGFLHSCDETLSGSPNNCLIFVRDISNGNIVFFGGTTPATLPEDVVRLDGTFSYRKNGLLIGLTTDSGEQYVAKFSNGSILINNFFTVLSIQTPITPTSGFMTVFNGLDDPVVRNIFLFVAADRARSCFWVVRDNSGSVTIDRYNCTPAGTTRSTLVAISNTLISPAQLTGMAIYRASNHLLLSGAGRLLKVSMDSGTIDAQRAGTNIGFVGSAHEIDSAVPGSLKFGYVDTSGVLARFIDARTLDETGTVSEAQSFTFFSPNGRTTWLSASQSIAMTRINSPTPSTRTGYIPDPAFVLSQSSFRGLYEFNNLLYGVVSNRLVVQTRAGALINFETVSTIETFNGPVVFADNGQFLTFCDGFFRYAFSPENNILVKVNEGEEGSTHVAFIGNRFVYNVANSGVLLITEPFPQDLNTGIFIEATASPDNVVVIVSDRFDLWAFGEETTEIFTLSPDPDAPLVRRSDGLLQIGCASPYTVVNLSGAIFWVGRNRFGVQGVFLGSGLSVQEITIPPLSAELRRLSDRLSSLTAFGYAQEGHNFYVLNLIDTSYVYDLRESQWHERRSLDSNNRLSRYKAQWCAVQNNQIFVSDYQTPDIYVLDLEYFKDDTFISSSVNEGVPTPVVVKDAKPVVRERTIKLIENDQTYGRLIFNKVELDVAKSTVSSYADSDEFQLLYSDNEGKTWTGPFFSGNGKLGDFGVRCYWNNVGISQTRIYKIRTSINGLVSLGPVYVDVEATQDRN
jgi:hypothetical protein